MEERELLEITPLSKGVIAFAKATKAFYGDWIILIRELEKTNYDDFLIYTHVSYCLGGKIDDANVGINDKWGDLKSNGFQFYKPTEEEVNLIKKLLKKSAYGTSNKIEEAIQNHLKQQEVKK